MGAHEKVWGVGERLRQLERAEQEALRSALHAKVQTAGGLLELTKDGAELSSGIRVKEAIGVVHEND